MRILVVEDEKKLADFLKRGLEEELYTVDIALDGEEGWYLSQVYDYDLIILDIMLPQIDGLTLCRRWRSQQVPTPILLLTARDAVEDKVMAIDLGADDYLVKPFALPELLARIRALLRRGRPSEVFRLKTADLELDLVTRRAVRGERLLELTAREFELLEYLLRHQGHLVSREMLAREVWREPRRATPLDNVIDVQITRLRKKVDTEGNVRLIHTVRGVGFVLREGEP